ncbi:MAG: hypothetical protein PHW87_01500 [Methanothrix sp.]|nr:hypothetical protein [Methanothrix sp.]
MHSNIWCYYFDRSAQEHDAVSYFSAVGRPARELRAFRYMGVPDARIYDQKADVLYVNFKKPAKPMTPS